MITIVGLGNIGEEYKHTRHNIGWMVLESFILAHGLPSLIDSGKVSGAISEGTIGNTEVTILFPHTYMNNSGSAVRKALPTDADLKSLVVVHDDIDLPLGEVKIGVGKGSSGHNGVQSIIDTLGSKEFVRVRIGIGERNFLGMLKRPRGEALSNFVLGDFRKGDAEKLEEIKKKVDGALMEIIQNGVETAMQRVNAE